MASSNLNIAGASYGRDSAGTRTVINNLKGDITDARRALTGADYSRVISTVRQYWSGEDADKFINEFKKTVRYIDSQYSKFNGLIDSLFNSDKRQFTSMQATNAASIKATNKTY